jgi:hypothetical protein
MAKIIPFKLGFLSSTEVKRKERPALYILFKLAETTYYPRDKKSEEFRIGICLKGQQILIAGYDCVSLGRNC